MFLSIIIPIWNDEKYLEECLDSCLDQDISKDEYEIICVDDGSTDKTPDILRSYAETNQNIRLIFKEHGVGNGRTIGYKVAVGDYLWFVDHDDIIAPNAVPELYKFASENLNCDRIIFSYYQFFDSLSEDEKNRMRTGDLRPNDGDRHRFAVIWDSIFSRKFFLDHDIFPRSKRIDEAGKFWGISPFVIWGGDTVVNEEFSDKSGTQAILIGRPLYYYRRHDNSQTMIRSSEYLKKKETWVYNRALLELYLVSKLKEQYKQERSRFGAAKQETVIPLIVKLRSTLKHLAGMPTQYWKEGIRLVKEKDCFFQNKPPEYQFSYLSYMKLKALRDRILPRTSLEYYLYTERAAKLYRIVDSLRRYRERIGIFLRLKNHIKKMINRTRGRL